MDLASMRHENTSYDKYKKSYIGNWYTQHMMPNAGNDQFNLWKYILNIFSRNFCLTLNWFNICQLRLKKEKNILSQAYFASAIQVWRVRNKKAGKINLIIVNLIIQSNCYRATESLDIGHLFKLNFL